jgi:CheY-like chemotaxis protein
MSGMSGLELVMLLKRKRPEMKIVLMTAFEIDKNELQKIIPLVKIDGFVKKPFRSALLIETVKQACSVPTR